MKDTASSWLHHIMTPCIPCATTGSTSVGMSQAAIAADTACLTTIVGSCIAVAIYSARERLGALGHVVLPRATGSTDYPAKFADTAVPYMLAALKERGVKPGGLVARIAGGACMFGDCKVMQIGQSNTEAVVEALRSAAIRIVGRDVGGASGRRISFDLATGLLTVQCIGQPSQTI
jgi:chemotaxis protein CheD